MLSEIARTLDEEMSLKETETRISSQLGRLSLKERVEKNVLSLGAERIKEETLLMLDISDITKRYACRMEYRAEVQDGSAGQIGIGW